MEWRYYTIYISGLQTVEIKMDHGSINYNDTNNKTIRANIHKDEPYQISCNAPNSHIKECLFKNPSGKVYILCPGGWYVSILYWILGTCN